jgi:hypothetical protein
VADRRLLHSEYWAYLWAKQRADEETRTPGLLTTGARFNYWPIEKANRMHGYRPRYNFPEFIESHKRGERSHYPYADLPWWGV